MTSRTYDIPASGVLQVGELWVISKPSGLASHPSAGLDDDLLSWCRREHGASRDLAPMNRLDRATSGLVLASECAKTRARIGDAFASQEVAKTYLALVHGRIAVDVTIDRPLLDRRRGKKLPATTQVKLLTAYTHFSHIEVTPKTGRKHQIRRHLRGANHAIVGDTRYGSKGVPVGAPNRLWLHCSCLVLPNGLTFNTPLPPELDDHLVHLNLRSTR